ncbi:MAG: BMP family ABC transporter substrate-binding protein [Spirochaetales bacterium]|nr:BMP family ABC transporter substrate-binding protein [Spirochaetales bacterium]
MKRLIVLLLALSLALPLFAGGAEEGGAAAPSGPKYKIGIVFDIGGRGDQSFNDSAYNGMVLLAKEFNGYIKDDPSKVDHGREIELKYLEPKAGGQDREQLLRAMAEDGYDLMIGVGFLFTDSITKVAADFPNQHFGIIDGFIPDLNESSNITCLAFAEHEGSFLVGAIAGLMNEGGKVGFIGGMDIPLIHKFHGGFFAGAMYVNPELRKSGNLLGQYCGKDPTAFNDPKTAESIAVNFFNEGATIIYHAAGGSGTGLFKAAKDMNKWAIGVDSDQGLIYATSENPEEKATAEYILTSMLKRVDNAIYLSGKELIETGKNAGGYRTFGLADEGVGYAVNDYNEAKLQPVMPKVDEIKQMIIDGKITVPDDDAKVSDWAAETF